MRKIDTFWDSSALVPLFTRQFTTGAVASELKRRSITVWWGSVVEVASALCRLLRAGDISEAAYARAASHLGDLRQQWFEITPSERIRELAQLLVRRHPLSAADAMQLAAALEWSADRPQHRPFLCLDQRLAEAARAEGFQVETA